MVVFQSNRFGIQEEKERICKNKMDSEDKSKVDSMKEGEVSVLDSAKSMGKEDFKVSKQPSKTIPSPTANFASTTTPMTAATSATADSSNRYWMKDLYKYGYPRGYSASGLYNLAWAQAVQNKPLNEVLHEFQKGEGLKAAHGGGGEEEKGARVNSHTSRSSEQIASGATNGDESGAGGRTVVAIDDDREEGELEEGEIDLDSEVMQVEVKGSISGAFGETGVEDEELEDRVPLIRKVLENVNTTEAEKSFDVVCARLRSSVESLQQLVLHCWFPSKDALIHQSFMGFKCVNSVFSAMGPLLREQNRNAMTRLVTYVMGLQPALFSPQQMKEIESMMTQITPDSSQSSIARDKLEQLPVMDKAILTDSNTLSVNTNYESEPLENFDINPSSSAFDMIDTSKKVGLCLSDMKGVSISDFVRPSNLPTMKGKTGIGPLLDLHRVHDLDSLPSPTHKDPSQQSATQMLHSGDVVHPYEKDALRAFSSYQQKFAHRTFLSNELPSPTPSEEGKDGEADDETEEVSSSFGVSTLVQPVLQHQVVSSAPNTTSLGMQRLISGATAGVRGAGVSLASQATTKSRDPRLRYMNADSSALDGPAMKKQRNGLEDTGIASGRKDLGTLFSPLGPQSTSLVGPPFVNKSSPGTSVTDPRKKDNLAAGGSSPALVNTGTSITLQSLLRDIAGNPAAWVNVLEEQRKSSEPSKVALDLTSSSSLLHPKPFPSVASANASVMGQQAGGSADFPPVAQRDKSANVRMKPRDPRRVLHASTERSRNSGSQLNIPNEVSTARTPGVKESLDAQKPINGTDSSGLPSRPTVLPDITRQFTKSLKNIADIMSVSQASALPTLSSKAPSEVAQAQLGVNSISAIPLTSGNQLGEPALKAEEVTSGPARSWTTWTDVEHLFDGYDEQQKAAIQKERTRRIEEQKKMFSARKLCLVLDLDHTLLNSAKFTEVDPIHDEILRKKEEQDREKPYRHLFCLPHMAMWTKLRPGIWNFLEKASKLYELHLYTMGNKLYANEMAKVLDPKGVLFAGRVISRGNDGDLIDSDERVPKSKDLEGVLGMESAVVIIDDSIRVWPHNKLNLIAVERYIYFPCSRRQFGLPGPSLLEIDHDERAEDGTLAASLSVIERIHANFFSHERLDDVDVRNILAFEQQKILAGCRIVFSRVFPVGEVNPHLHPLWQTAEQFGAVCTNQIDEQVTHVVANSLGTDKVNWALSTGRYVVHPGWVEASALLYRRANELDFAIKS